MFSPSKSRTQNLLHIFGKQIEHLDLNSLCFNSWLTEVAVGTLLSYQSNQNQGIIPSDT